MAREIEYVANLNLQGNEIKNFVVEVVTEAPTTDALGKAGRLVSFGGNLYISDGVNFSKLGSAGDVSSLTSRISAVEAKNTSQDTAIQQNSTDIATNTGAISGLDTRLGTAEGKITAAEGEIDTLQSDMTTAKSDISTLKTTVGDAESGLVKDVNDNAVAIATKANSADVYTKTIIDGKVSALETSIGTKANSADVYTKDQVDTTLALYRTVADSYDKTTVDNKISNAVSSAYKVKGTVATADKLPAEAQVGDVYNITAASSYGPAGTNVVWDGTEWDALGGIIDLTDYATITYVDGKVVDLTSAINKKVDQTAYDSKIGTIDSTLSSHTTLLEGLRSDVDAKVAQTTYDSKMTALDTAIAARATKVSTGAGTWTGKITVNAEGIVTAGANLVAADIPDITADKISDFAATVKTVRFQHSYTTDQTTMTIEHNLGVDWPQVTVYNTTSKAIIYADVVYVDANTVTINGNMALGSITVVVSP
ncbi:MAG: hypothetical protein IJX35_00015 [Candidatus Methanomethylophilaceae archaeon]|nr:hypothetical protein [Candidatus Methanomethylophilaceae archaeon]